MKSRIVIPLLLLLLSARGSIAQQSDAASFGIELGFGTRTEAASGLLARGFYSASFGAVEMEVGVLMTTVADNGFGFDVKTLIPIESRKQPTALVASVGLNSIVWSNTVSIGVPLGMHYRMKASDGIVIEPSVHLIPSYSLTPADKNFVLVDICIGIRF